MKKVLLVSALFSSAVVVSVFFIFYMFTTESANYRLYGEIHELAAELKKFEKDNGRYPTDLSEIRESNKLCIARLFLTACKRVKYRPSDNLQDFRLAIKSFSWSILYYHPEVSLTTDEYQDLTEQEKKNKSNQYKIVCFYCEAFPSGKKWLRGGNTETPVYKETVPIFSNPDKWPDL